MKKRYIFCLVTVFLIIGILIGMLIQNLILVGYIYDFIELFFTKVTIQELSLEFNETALGESLGSKIGEMMSELVGEKLNEKS